MNYYPSSNQSTNPYVTTKSNFSSIDSNFTIEEFNKKLSLGNNSPMNLNFNLANNYTMITENNNSNKINRIISTSLRANPQISKFSVGHKPNEIMLSNKNNSKLFFYKIIFHFSL